MTSKSFGSHRSRDRMAVGFTTTYAIGAYHHWCCWFKFCSGWGVQHDVIKFVSDLRQVSGFLQVLQFPPSIKTDCHDLTEILLKVALNTKKTNQPSQIICLYISCLYRIFMVDLLYKYCVCIQAIVFIEHNLWCNDWGNCGVLAWVWSNQKLSNYSSIVVSLLLRPKATCLRIRIIFPSGAACLPMDCCFSELAP